MTSKTNEEVIDKIGSFGWFQFRVFLIVSYAILSCSSVLMVMTFSTAEPPWKCVANATSCNLTGSHNPGDKDYEYRCKIPRNDWRFDVDGDFDSIVMEWDLVCDTAVYASLANSLLFILWMFGAMLASILSDKYGRKIVIFPFVLLTCGCGFLSAFAQQYWVFALLRALTGVGLGGYSVCVFVLIMEYVGVRHRSIVGIGVWTAWILSLFLLALLGYFIQNWRMLTIITSAPGLLIFLFWWFTPESLRWLIVRGKFEEVKKTLKDAARVNKKIVTDSDLASLGDDAQNEVRLGDIRDLFASTTLVHRTLVSWYCWLVSGLVYYGISLSTPTIGGNMYLNFFISAVCEAGGMMLAVPMLNRFGRKKSIVAALWLAGVSTVIAALLNYYDHDKSSGFLIGKIVTAMVLGKFFIIIAFDGVYVYSSELFPTVVRNTAMGTSTSAARVGSALAPYVVFSERAHTLMPFGIMAINAVLCGIICMTLPETSKVAMPDTVQQVTKERDNLGADEENTAL